MSRADLTDEDVAVLEVLAEAWPESLTEEAIAKRAGIGPQRARVACTRWIYVHREAIAPAGGGPAEGYRYLFDIEIEIEGGGRSTAAVVPTRRAGAGPSAGR